MWCATFTPLTLNKIQSNHWNITKEKFFRRLQQD